MRLSLSPQRTKGFTLLFTVLITSIILAITLGISRVSYTEMLFSSVSREGARAFFASDTGLECALLHDLEYNTFVLSPSSSIDCAYSVIPSVVASPTPPPESSNSVSRFEFEIETSPNSCARVFVYKDWVIGSDAYTRVESLGYNRSCVVVANTLNAQGGALDPKLVERALRATYKNAVSLGGSGGSGSGGGGLGGGTTPGQTPLPPSQ